MSNHAFTLLPRPHGNARIKSSILRLGLPVFILPVLAAQLLGAAYSLSGGSDSQSSQTYSSTTADESSVKVTNSGKLALTNVTTSKTGDSSDVDESSKYGLNAGILANSAGTVSITTGTISTAASGANGLFATGTGSAISMTGGSIYTSGSASHGVDVTYGGNITLVNVDVTTLGDSASAAISTDYGGGTVTVTGGTIKTSGAKSPAIYSTGVITISNATMTASGGQGGIIDGANSIILNNCSLTGSSNAFKLHRSASSSGAATVTIAGGTIKSTGGDLFYLQSQSGTGTANLTVKDGAALSCYSGNLVNCTTNTTANLVLDGETLTGNLVADSTSTVNATLQNASSLTGTASATSLTIDSTSTWTASGASTLTSINTAGTLGVANLGSSISVTGKASLGGTLAVSLSSSASAGTYPILSAGSISGTFANLKLTQVGGTTLEGKLSYASTAVTLTLSASTVTTLASPVISTQPADISAAAGNSVTVTVTATGGGLSYQWYKDGLSIGGATSPSYIISSLSASSAGSYKVVVSNTAGSITSDQAFISLSSGSLTKGRLVNSSVRGIAGTGDNSLITGFVISDGNYATVVVRAIGPTLTGMGVSGALANPMLTLYSSGVAIAKDDDWDSSGSLSSTMTSLGAFSLATGSKDAVLRVTLPAGAYSAVVSSFDGTSTGVVLLEVYEVP